MARQIKTIDYDTENDIFYMSNGEKVQFSLDIGDFILDVNHDNLICGLEVMDASENLGVSREFLGGIQAMKMLVTYKTNHVYVLLMITFKKEDKEVTISIPLTIGLGHKSPKKEVLVYN
ncbi:MAG TPA: DUF2283 domain-containing protein [Candidatus Nanoarchaeia archaeon]|nr:DUF2283 domain-containing protein [Candidatus Nanoarchaeia archaeon]